MPYDYQGAINAGANQNDVINYMSGQTNYDAQGAIKAGANPTDVMKYMSNLPIGNQQQPQQPSGNGIINNIGGFFAGGFKSAVSAPFRVAQAIGEGGTAIANAITGKNLQTGIPQVPQSLQPNGLPQQIGAGAEQLGELFIPTGLEAKVASKLAEIPELAQNAPLIQKIAMGIVKSGAKTLTNAGEFAGKTYLQTGGNASEATKAGMIAGATNPIIEGAGNLLSKIPETTWGSILKRVPTAVSKNPDLESQIAKEGIVGITRPQISATLGRGIQNTELQIADILSNKEGSIATQDVANRLTDLRAKYANIPGEQTSVNAIDNVKQELLDKGENLSLADANQLKRDIYGVVAKSYGKGLLEVPAKIESQKMIALGLKQELEKAVPELKPLNGKQAIYIQAKNAIDKTIARGTGKGIAGTHIGLYDLMAGGLGETQAGIPGIAAGIAIKKAVESPLTLSGTSFVAQKVLDYFNGLSPTQKVLFYNGLKGLTIKSTQSNQQ